MEYTFIHKCNTINNKTKEKDSVTYGSECIKYMLSIRDDISEKEMKKTADKTSVEGGGLVISATERLRQEGFIIYCGIYF